MNEQEENSSKNKDFEDDGRVIANMDIDGMPWSRGAVYEKKPSEPKFRDLNIANGLHEGAGAIGSSAGEPEEISKEDRKWYVLGALKAALLIGAAFGVVFLIFILFCVFVWFR